MTWNPNDGINFDASAMIEVLNEVSKEHISGITFSGGDPLHPKNRFGVSTIINAVKRLHPKKTVWVYTGYTWEEILRNAELIATIKHADVLVDGRFDEALASKSFRWAGSLNQRVIDIQKSIKKGKVVLHESN